MVGICVRVSWSTVGGSWSPRNHVSLQATRARLVASHSDDRSIEDRERNSWVDWCNSAFRNGISTFPSDADDP